MKKKMKVILIIICTVILVLGISVSIAVGHFVGFPECVGEKKTAFHTEEIHVQHDGIDLYGIALIPDGDGPFPTVIYAHGAESDHKADMTTLKSLTMSGIACYTFDFYGWSTRSTGPQKGDWFKNQPRGVDERYEKQVLEQVKDLNAVIETVKGFNFVDANRLYLLGSSMGGATVAACSVTHSEDIRAIILQFPAINLVPTATVDGGEYDVNQYTPDVLLLQGTEDTIVPQSMSDALAVHYNQLRPDPCRYVVYERQPHVFTGKYKVEAAREIYRFIQEHQP